MVSVNIQEAETRLSELLQLVESENETIILCRDGIPVAELSPCKTVKNPLKQSAQLKNVQFYEDASLPLSEDDWPGLTRQT